MPEYIRALIVIFVLAAVSMKIMRKPALLLGIEPQDYKRRCLSWLCLTAAAFLASSFWIFSLAAAGVLWFAARREPNPPVLYLFVLFAIPPLSAFISGLGVFQQLFQLSYSRLLSLLILLPAFVMIGRVRHSSRRSFGSVDWLIIAYIILTLILQLSVDTFTNTLRHALYKFLDIFLPYFVLSRYVVTLEARRQAVLAFVMGILLLCPIAVFEFFKHWLLYASLPAALGLSISEIPAYIGRGDSIRAMASSGQPIVLGYMMVVAILLHAGVDRTGGKAKYWIFSLAVLCAGVVAPLSRGPWVGLAGGLFVLWLTSPNRRDWLMKLTIGSLVALPMLVITGAAITIIDYLPFVGTVDSNNVDYRSTLIEVAWQIIWLNPWFGSFDFLQHPAMAVLDQGGGAVDLTNTYVVVALSNGLVGLTLFVGVFFVASVQLLRALNTLGRSGNELFTQGRILLAAIAATLVTIATVSSISFVPTVYWCLCGLAVGYSHQVGRKPCSSRVR
jgi:hypothetical protein